MKRMTLDEEEEKIIVEHRAKKSREEYDAKQKIIRDNCKHNFELDFHNYKTTYYKCSKCGQRSTS